MYQKLKHETTMILEIISSRIQLSDSNFSPLFLIRAQDVTLRKEYVNLIEGVRDSGGDVKMFSSMHISGERKYFEI